MSAPAYTQLLRSAQMIKIHEGVLNRQDIAGVNKIEFLSEDKSTHIERSILLVESDEEQAIYIVFPGSNDKDDWIANFQFRFQDMIYKAAAQVVAQAQEVVDLVQAYSEIGMTTPHENKEGSERWSDQKVHSGFMRSYYAIADKAMTDLRAALDKYPDATVYGTGHSLGTAIMRFMVLDAQYKGMFDGRKAPILFTYGAPRMGNAAFTQSLIKRIPNIYRVVHGHDLVTRLPLPLIGYRHETSASHIGPQSWFRWYYRDDIRDHYLENYIKNLSTLSKN